MKKEQKSFFGSLFGAQGSPSEIGQSRPVTVTSFSQPHVLRQRMKEEQLTHGETVMVNLSPVRLEKGVSRVVMYFCPLKTIEVLSTSANGDGGELPGQAIVEGLRINQDFKPGLYTLKNVQLTSNGTMQVTAANETSWEMVAMEL